MPTARTQQEERGEKRRKKKKTKQSIRKKKKNMCPMFYVLEKNAAPSQLGGLGVAVRLVGTVRLVCSKAQKHLLEGGLTD
eukprot:m.229582 g.229582  ORF g.229582 m.229582 type:complete len:80 (-) comp22401_c4_seq1:8905-9144(-)